MSRLTNIVVGVTIATFLGFFIIEALLWTWPLAYQLLLPQLNPGLGYPLAEQADTLRALFINQGVYNLMVAIGGIAGLVMANGSNPVAGRLLVRYTCLFALGAAVTLLATTEAYALGILQGLFPLAALLMLRREGR